MVLGLRIYMDIRLQAREAARTMVLEGIKGIERQGPYCLDEALVPVRVEITEVKRFSPFAVNVRVYDKKSVRRRFFLLRPFNNVSRCYMGARWTGFLKLERFLLRFPDMFINLDGRRLETVQGMRLMQSVVLHEFGHVFGFKDKYRFRDDRKRNKSVADDDLMYRTGDGQCLQAYHIQRLLACAKKGRIPIKRV